MTTEKQRIAIAEACGWKMHDHPDCLAKKEGWVSRDWETWVMNPSGLLVFKHDIPDYLNDLNAMAEAETCEAIQRVGYAKYIECLAIACGTERLGALVFATAAQRAEAFLRTIGKWEDDK
jgi:hypothetical protein